MILIKNGIVIDPKSELNEKMDILIEGEKIKKIRKTIKKEELKEDTKIINAQDMIICPGFIDIHCHFRDPGYTYKEDIISGSNSALRGGYTTAICMANTNPVVDNENTLNYIKQKAKLCPIEVLQVASITKNMEGKELVNMEKLKEKGAIGFSDDGKPLLDSALVMEAMKKASELNVPLSFHEEDPNLIYESGINFGKIAKKLNLKGATRESEEVLIARDAVMAISTKAKVNIQHISSGNSVEIIKWAKEMGANITAEVTPHHFTLIDEDVLSYGTNAKMNPPLRSHEDKEKIIKGIKEGIIEIIATDHAPHSKEEKEREFIKAPSGIIGLETAFSLGITELVRKGHISLMGLIKMLTVNPSKLYNLDRGYIKENSIANIVIFNPNEKYKVESFQSKANNSPFLGKELYGKIRYVISKGNIY